ncbi:MAG: hypothetical protein BZY75_04545 [SAR202 cluster bacterium Io17-Chloro-G7]|nr:MAG: hypothetical protein BZY75_04545 [SAR202 cluster bacterium Io17-Chloro-G7]
MTTPQIKVFRGEDHSQPDTEQTSGMSRQELAATASSWVGMVRISPGMVSGWHHQGDNDSYIYVVSGRARGEFGSGGKEHVEAGPGEVIHVPKHIVHREINPADQETLTFLVRVGLEPYVVNVDGPQG